MRYALHFKVRFQSPNGRRLDDLNFEKGDWYHSSYFTQINACKEWGIRPSKLGLCQPEDDLAVMIAFLSDRNAMEAYSAQIRKPKPKPK